MPKAYILINTEPDVEEEFIGGCDIVKEMFETGELLELFNTKGIDVRT